MKLKDLPAALAPGATLTLDQGRVALGQAVLDLAFPAAALAPFEGAPIVIKGVHLVSSNAGGCCIQGRAAFPAPVEPVRGLASPLRAEGADVLLTLEQLASGELGVSLRWPLPQDWCFSQSFPELGLVFDDAAVQWRPDSFRLQDSSLNLTTHSHALAAGSNALLDPGLNIVTHWSPDGLLALFAGTGQTDGQQPALLLHGPVVTQAASPAIHGQPQWETRHALPGIHLRASLGDGVTLPPGSEQGFRLAPPRVLLYMPLCWQPPFEPGAVQPQLVAAGDLLGAGRDGQKLAEFQLTQRSAADDELVLTCTVDGTAAIARLCGGDDTRSALQPTGQQPAAGAHASCALVLRRGAHGFEVVESHFKLLLDKDVAAWSPFKPPHQDRLKLGLQWLNVSVAAPFDSGRRQVYASMQGKAAFLGLQMGVNLQMPGYHISAVQQGSTLVDLDFLNTLGWQPPEFLKTARLQIEGVTLTATPGKRYAFALKLAAGAHPTWPALQLGVICTQGARGTHVDWQLAASPQDGQVAASITALGQQLDHEVPGLQLQTADFPGDIQGLGVTSLVVRHDGGTGEYGFECQSTLILQGASGKPISVVLTVDAARKAGATTARFRGAFSLDVHQTQLHFSAEIAKTGQGTVLRCAARVADGVRLSHVVRDVAARLAGLTEQPEIPEALDPVLVSLSGLFNLTTKAVVLTATTEAGSRFAIVVDGKTDSDAGGTYAVLLDRPLRIGLSSLPLVGESFAGTVGQSLGIEDIGIDSVQASITHGLGANDADHARRTAALNALLEATEHTPGDLPRLPFSQRSESAASRPQLALSVRYFLAEKLQPPLAFLEQPSSRSALAADVAAGNNGPAAVQAAAQSQALSQATWMDVQCTYGPVSVRRLGIACVQGKVRLLLDASLTASGLTMELQGLSLAFAIKSLTQFDRAQVLASLRKQADGMSTGLDGLSLRYENGAIALSGGLLTINPPPKPALYACNGHLILKANTWALSVVGAFAQLEDGSASLLAYGVLNAAIGGPGFFFVTGIAAGFGYNRQLTLPTLDTLPDFPLIAAVTGNGSGARLSEDIQAYAYPAIGQHWLAAGVRFTSFRVFDSFALLTVSFGDRLELGLMGVSTLTVPAKTSARTAVKPIARAQLALLARYAPDDGVLKIAAQLAPDSYILSESCLLTGGFALHTWSHDETEKDGNGSSTGQLVPGGFRAGDFVFSIGGYHPGFQPPAHYPQVPRVAANWQAKDLVIKGSLYFALTPLAIMAGGTLEANYHRGHVKAWFTARFDFLTYWEPLRYQAHVQVGMGVSFTMDWGATTKTIAWEVAAEMDLYGPPFGGHAVVNLSVCSFTLDFGEPPRPAPLLTWPEFESRFLPEPAKVCLSRAGGGLIREIHEGDDVIWVVSPEEFVIVTACAIPSSERLLVSGALATVQPDGSSSAAFGIQPCGLVNGRLKSQQTVEWLEKDGGAAITWAVESVTERLPRAAWHAPAPLSGADAAANSLQRSADARMLQELQGEQVCEALTTGFRLTPQRPSAPAVQQGPDIAISALPMRSRDIAIAADAWQTPTLPLPGRHDDDNASEAKRYTRLSGIAAADGAAAAARQAVAAALRRQSMAARNGQEFRYLAAAAQGHALLTAPRICALGEVDAS